MQFYCCFTLLFLHFGKHTEDEFNLHLQQGCCVSLFTFSHTHHLSHKNTHIHKLKGRRTHKLQQFSLFETLLSTRGTWFKMHNAHVTAAAAVTFQLWKSQNLCVFVKPQRPILCWTDSQRQNYTEVELSLQLSKQFNKVLKKKSYCHRTSLNVFPSQCIVYHSEKNTASISEHCLMY